MTRAAFVLLAMAMAVPAAQVRTTMEIRGRVVAAENGAALARVRLAAVGVTAPAEPVFTDDEGRFVLTLPSTKAMPLRVNASKAGFATTAFDIAQDDAGPARQIDLRLPRGAAISGRVVNLAGGPVVSAVVMVRPAPSSGAAGIGTVPPVAVLTDDRGEYRTGGLREGRYLVQVLTESHLTTADLAMSLEVGIGTTAFRDQVADFNQRLQNEPLDLPSSASEPVFVAVRPGDEFRLGDLIVTPHADGGSCRAASDVYSDGGSATASIRGRVLDSAGRPLSCAMVALVPEIAPGPRSVVGTDASGRFTYTAVPAGDYRIEAFKPAYIGRWYGQDAANRSGRTIAVADGEPRDRIDITLPRRPAITGTVLDDRGEPVAGVTVRALHLRRTGDLTMAVHAPGVGVRASDDSGRYRIFGLSPGRYLIRATVDASISGARQADGYAPIFHPGTTDVATALPVDVEGGGGDVDGINLVLVRSPTRRISGLALGRSGRPASEVLVFPSYRSTGILLEPRRVAVGPDGAFSVSNVAAGEYVVQVYEQSTDRDVRGDRLPPVFGMQYVTVADRDPAPVTLRASAGATIEGRMTVRGGGTLPHGDIWTMPTDYDRSPPGGGGYDGLALFDEGRFRIAGVTGPRRLLLQGAPDGWYLESITLNGRDLMNTPFDFGLEERRFGEVEAVLSDAASSVAGRAVDGRGDPVPSAGAIVYSTDRSHWFRNSPRLNIVSTDRDGTFRVGTLPPGEYFVVVVDGLETRSRRDAEWQDPALLDALSSRAERITLDEREVHRGDFRIVRP